MSTEPPRPPVAMGDATAVLSGGGPRRRAIQIVGAAAAGVLALGLVATLSSSDGDPARPPIPPASVRAEKPASSTPDAPAERIADDVQEVAQRELDSIVDDARRGNVDEARRRLDEFVDR